MNSSALRRASRRSSYPTASAPHTRRSDRRAQVGVGRSAFLCQRLSDFAREVLAPVGHERAALSCFATAAARSRCSVSYVRPSRKRLSLRQSPAQGRAPAPRRRPGDDVAGAAFRSSPLARGVGGGVGCPSGASGRRVGRGRGRGPAWHKRRGADADRGGGAGAFNAGRSRGRAVDLRTAGPGLGVHDQR